MFRFSYSRIAFYLAIALTLIACVQPAPPSDANISMTLEILPDPPVVGESELAITLTDGDDAPITDATLEIVGDMNHAGMVPVVRDLETAGEDGIYRVPFEWVMGGDWFVTVFAILKDGTEVEQIFDMTVIMADDTAMDHSEMNSDPEESHAEDAHSEEMDHNHSDTHDSEAEQSEADDHAEDTHSEEIDHGHGDAAAESHEEGEMDHNHDAGKYEMTNMSQSIDTSALHEIDEAARGGTIEPEALTALQTFAETLNGLELPDEYTADIEAVNIALVDFEAAMDAEDMDTATTLISEMHDIAHDMKIRLTNAAQESEPTEDDGHEHEHD